MNRHKSVQTRFIIEVVRTHRRGGCSESKQPFRTCSQALFLDALDYSNTILTNDYQPLLAFRHGSTPLRLKSFAAHHST